MWRVPRKPIVILLFCWATVTVLVLPQTPAPPRGLMEAVLILLASLPLALYPPVRSALSRQSRVFRRVLLGSVVVWYAAQIGEVRDALYPLVSWHMYAEPVAPDEIVEASRLWGELCSGGAQLVPWQGGAFGRRPTLRPRASRLAKAGDVGGPALDSLLTAALALWNEYPGNPPLCRLELQRVLVPSKLAGHLPLPPYTTFRAVTLR